MDPWQAFNSDSVLTANRQLTVAVIRQPVVNHWSQRPRSKIPIELIGNLAPIRIEGLNLRGVFNFPFEDYIEQLMLSC